MATPRPLRAILSVVLFLALRAAAVDLRAEAAWSWREGLVGQGVGDVRDERFVPLRELERLETLVEDGIGVVWVRAVFHLPDSVRTRDPALLTSSVSVADEVFLDGVRVGGGGRFPPRFFSGWNEARLWRVIPAATGPDTLFMKIYVHHEGGIQGSVEIGPYGELESRWKLMRFVGVDLNLVFSVILVLIALHHLLIFANRPKDRYHGHYALLCVSFATYLANFYAPSIPGFMETGISYLAFQKVVFVAMYLAAFALGSFVARYLGRDDPEWFRFLYGLPFAIVALLCLGASDFGAFETLRHHVDVVLVIPVLYILHSLFVGVLRRQPGVRTILVGIAPLLACSLYDLIVREWMRVPGAYLTGLGAGVFMIAVLLVVSMRFVRNANEVERLNHELELEVIVRTNQLKEANLHLERTMIDLRDANRRLEGLVVTDGLTQVFNRRAFDLRFDEEFSRARRQRSSLSLLMVDIDHFKRVNDSFGHLVGDHCLVAVASAIQSSLKRSTDVLARFGGEEFVVLLPETDAPGAVGIAETIRSGIEGMTVVHEDRSLRLTASIGVASMVPEDRTDRAELLASADAALYRAKIGGRNRVVLDGLDDTSSGG